MSTLEKVGKNIPRTISILVSFKKKVLSKNQTFLSLFWTETLAITIL